jgi:flagellar basal body-associated protein FliL
MDKATPPPQDRREQGYRIEVKAVIVLVIAIIAVGGAYVAFFGSPAHENAARDDSNAPAAPIIQKTK